MSPTEPLQHTLGILGFGKVGEAIAVGLLRRNVLRPEQLLASARRSESAASATERTGVSVGTDNHAVIRGADTLIVAVKPQSVKALLQEARTELRPDTLIISVAASVTTKAIEALLPEGTPVIRVMPNTPCLLGEGMSVIARGTHASADHIALAEAIFCAVGRTIIMDERHMDSVTGLSGSGPAYIYLVIESLAEAGVKLGIPRDTATILSAQTVLGAARMVLEHGAHPALLKDAVTTPAGCTIDGLLELEEGGLRVTLVKAVVKAAERARALATEQ